jgi:hypothetical protein
VKTLICTLTFILFSVLLFAQNENPYRQFGYDAPIMPEQSKEFIPDKFLLINADTTSLVGALIIDPSKRVMTVFDKHGSVLQYDTLNTYTVARWMSPDPYGQFTSPYDGMGNNPVSGMDPDGGWFSPFNLTNGLIGAAAMTGLAYLTGNGDDAGWWALGGFAGAGFLTSDFAKVEIWGTHEARGLNAAWRNGKEEIQRITRMPGKMVYPPKLGPEIAQISKAGLITVDVKPKGTPAGKITIPTTPKLPCPSLTGISFTSGRDWQRPQINPQSLLPLSGIADYLINGGQINVTSYNTGYSPIIKIITDKIVNGIVVKSTPTTQTIPQGQFRNLRSNSLRGILSQLGAPTNGINFGNAVVNWNMRNEIVNIGCR